jgi:hypothetical protein
LNNSVHSGIDFAPFEVVYGLKAKLPLDLAFHELQENKVQAVDDLVRSR